MANVKDIKRQPVKITLTDGIERELKYTLNALVELEEAYGSVEGAFNKLEQNSIKALRSVLYAGLMHTGEFTSEAQIGNLLDVEQMSKLMSSIETAIDGDMPNIAEQPTPVLKAVNDPNL